MTTVHFIYPYGSSISCPQAIGRNVAERLRRHYEVRQYDWDDTGVIDPGPDDVLLGHAHPAPWTIFRRSAKRRGWRRVIALSPYNHDPRQVSFFDAVISRCDHFLAITGNYWADSIGDSLFSHWAPKMVHVDLAVDRRDFPVIKKRFNPPGSRRFVYIGHAGWQKNTRYLQTIARMMSGTAFSWMGSGTRGIKGVRSLGRQDFTSEEARRLVAEHDFLLTVGRADANPATVLEGMAWGLVPVCTPTSGYAGYPGIVNLPLDDPAGAVGVLDAHQAVPEGQLLEMQEVNWQALDAHFNWDRFAGQVFDAIRSDASPALRAEDPGRKMRLRVATLSSPYSMLHPRSLRPLVNRALHGRMARAEVPTRPGASAATRSPLLVLAIRP